MLELYYEERSLASPANRMNGQVEPNGFQFINPGTTPVVTHRNDVSNDLHSHLAMNHRIEKLVENVRSSETLPDELTDYRLGRTISELWWEDPKITTPAT